MGTFNMDIDLYFWMIDRGDFEDDQRNKVEIDKSRVKLHVDHRQRIENAFYIGKIMHVIRKTIIKMTKRPFTLDPNLTMMKDLTSSVTKEYNWNIVSQELRKFNIRVNQEQKAQLIGGKHSLMHDILQQLYEYDQNLLAHAPQGAQSPYRNQDNNSEMNYTGEHPLEKGHGKFIKDSDSQIPPPRDFMVNNSATILAGAPTKKAALDPIRNKSPFQKELEMYNMGELNYVNSPQLNTSIKDLSNVDEIILDANYQGGRVGLSDCNSTLDFILEGLSQSLGMTQSQAATLLANNQKYLIHMCTKGMKGGDYKRLIGWYKLTIQFTPKLVELLDYEKNDIKALAMTMNVIKCGVFSTNAEVVNITGRCLNKIQSQITSDVPHLQMMVWEWLTTSQSITPGNAASAKKAKQTKGQKDLEKMVGEAGLIGMIRAYRTHGNEISDIFSAFLTSFGRDNYVELFTLQLKNHSETELEYLRIIHDLLPNLTSTTKGKQAFVDSGSLSMILDMCFQICEYQGGSINNDYRQVAIQLMVHIWKVKPEIVQSAQNDTKKPDTIVRILKNGTRDQSKGISQTSIHLSFYLLDTFASERNMFAPIIYKAMTFVLIESYMNMELREAFLKNFIQLFKQHPNIPIAILSEPLLKQIMINLEKQDNVAQRNINNILQPNSEYFTLNTTDFELFIEIANHPKINTNVAVPLIEIVCSVSWKNIILTRVSLKLLLILLAKFENNTKVFEKCQNIITHLIQTISDQDESKVQLYNEIKDNPKIKNKRKVSLQQQGSLNAGINQNTQNAKYTEPKPEKLDDTLIQAIINPRLQQEQSAFYMSMKTNERMIVNLLQVIIQTGIKVLSEFTREKLIEAYIKTEKNLKFSNKGILYLLQFFEKDVSKLLSFSKQQQAKEKSVKIEQKKLLKEQAQLAERAKMVALNRSVDPYHDAVAFDEFNDVNLFNLQVNNSIDRDSFLRKQQTSPKGNQLEVPNSKKSMTSKKKSLVAPLLQDQDKNKSIMRYGTRDGDDIFERDSKDGRDSSIKRVYYPATLAKRQRKSVGVNKSLNLKADFYAKDDGQLRLYEINEDSTAEQHKYLQWVKDWLKLYKAMFQKYADNAIGKSRAPGTFDNIVEAKKFMNLASVFAFLQDFRVSKVEARRDDVKRIIQLINIKQESNVKTTSDIDLEGFIEFNLQLGHYLFKDQTIRPSKFMPMLFERFKEVSMATKTPLFQRLLENPNAPPVGDQVTLQYLTEQANKYPEAELPPGYVKVQVDRIKEMNGPDPLIYKKLSEQISASILDDLFLRIFGIHLLEPMIRYEKQWQVRRGDTKRPNPKAKYQEIGEKHRFKSYIELEEEKLALQNQNTRKLINRGISLDYDTSGDQSSPVKQRGIGSHSPNIQKRANYNKYAVQKNEPVSEVIRSELRSSQKDLHLRESGLLLDDMLGAVQKGKRQLSSRSPAPALSGRINKITEDRVNKALRDEEEKLIKEEKSIKRQQFLKNKIANYQQEKKAIELQKKQKDREEAQKIKQDEKKKQDQKKAFYDQLQREFEQTRLPQIAQNKQKELELKALLKEENKRKKEEAKRKIDENAQKLSKQFTEVAKIKETDLTDRSKSQVDGTKRFDLNKRVITPRKQAEVERQKLAQSASYKNNGQEFKVIKDLGPPPANLTAEKQRLGLEKKSTTVQPDQSRNNNLQGNPTQNTVQKRATQAVQSVKIDQNNNGPLSNSTVKVDQNRVPLQNSPVRIDSNKNGVLSNQSGNTGPQKNFGQSVQSSQKAESSKVGFANSPPRSDFRSRGQQNQSPYRTDPDKLNKQQTLISQQSKQSSSKPQISSPPVEKKSTSVK